jgi:hypothetical protein
LSSTREIPKEGIMKKMKKYHVIAVLAAAFLVAFPLVVYAIPITGDGSAGNSYKGEITYKAAGQSAILQLQVRILIWGALPFQTNPF